MNSRLSSLNFDVNVSSWLRQNEHHDKILMHQETEVTLIGKYQLDQKTKI
jgi:hypothetical protein